MLLARSRYLFIAMHRERFAERIFAELRGVIDAARADGAVNVRAQVMTWLSAQDI